MINYDIRKFIFLTSIHINSRTFTYSNEAYPLHYLETFRPWHSNYKISTKCPGLLFQFHYHYFYFQKITQPRIKICGLWYNAKGFWPVVVRHTVDFVVNIDGEGDTIQTLIADTTSETAGVVGLAHSLQDLWIQGQELSHR